MWKSAILLVTFLATSSLAATPWNEENCQGKVTDAICCQDEQPSERDAENNVCCQSPHEGPCSDAINGVCPNNYQVEERCCSVEAIRNIFTSDEGKVCCNAPEFEAEAIGKGCLPPLKPRSYSQSPYINSYSLGFRPNYIKNAYQPGKSYPSLVATMSPPSGLNTLNSNLFGTSHKTNEITVDDIIDLMVEALDNDDDVVKSDETLYTSPFGKSRIQGPKPFTANYYDPRNLLANVLSPFGLQGYSSGYGQSYGGYGQSYGGYGQSYGGYGQSYGGYGQSYGEYGQPYGGYSPPYGGYSPSYGGYGQSSGGYNPVYQPKY